MTIANGQQVETVAPYGDAVELVECGVTQANEYLEHGYQLVLATPVIVAANRPDGQLYIKRVIRYALKRSKDVDHYEPQRTPREAGGKNYGKG